MENQTEDLLALLEIIDFENPTQVKQLVGCMCNYIAISTSMISLMAEGMETMQQKQNELINSINKIGK